MGIISSANPFLDVGHHISFLLQESTDDVIAAFKVGAGVEAGSLATAISSIVIMFIILWVAWVVIAQFQSFSKGEITFYDMLWRVIRAVVVMLLFTIYVGT